MLIVICALTGASLFSIFIAVLLEDLKIKKRKKRIKKIREDFVLNVDLSESYMYIDRNGELTDFNESVF